MVTVLYFWRIRKIGLPIAILNMATNKLMLKRSTGISFIKLLGTGKGETFTPKDADQFRWGILVTIKQDDLDRLEQSLVLQIWRKISLNEYRIVLKPISSHGYWSGKQPFAVEKFEWSGKIAAITRARIVWRKNFQFWRAVPPVTLSLHQYCRQLELVRHPSVCKEPFQSGKVEQRCGSLHTKAMPTLRQLRRLKPTSGTPRSYLQDLP